MTRPSFTGNWQTTPTGTREYVFDAHRDPNTPRLLGAGPATCSTCVEVVRPFRMIWDVNCYYKHLGVPVDATKQELKRAYQRRNGQSSARLTFVLKQLLDPEVRAAYDATQPGSTFWDAEIEMWMKNERDRQATEIMVEAGRRGIRIDLDEAIRVVENEVSSDLWENLGDELDAASPRVQYRPPTSGWNFSFYLWKTDEGDVIKLRRWQELLVRELARRKESLQLAVGLHGDPSVPCIVALVGYRVVAFLSAYEQPSEQIAIDAAHRVVKSKETERGF
jgi:hypothetical protein